MNQREIIEIIRSLGGRATVEQMRGRAKTLGHRYPPHLSELEALRAWGYLKLDADGTYVLGDPFPAPNRGVVSA